MSKVITTYRIDSEVKKDLKILTVNEDMGSVSDMLRTLIDFYNIHRKQGGSSEYKTTWRI